MTETTSRWGQRVVERKANHYTGGTIYEMICKFKYAWAGFGRVSNIMEEIIFDAGKRFHKAYRGRIVCEVFKDYSRTIILMKAVIGIALENWLVHKLFTASKRMLGWTERNLWVQYTVGKGYPMIQQHQQRNKNENKCVSATVLYTSALCLLGYQLPFCLNLLPSRATSFHACLCLPCEKKILLMQWSTNVMCFISV